MVLNERDLQLPAIQYVCSAVTFVAVFSCMKTVAELWHSQCTFRSQQSIRQDWSTLQCTNITCSDISSCFVEGKGSAGRTNLQLSGTCSMFTKLWFQRASTVQPQSYLWIDCKKPAGTAQNRNSWSSLFTQRRHRVQANFCILLRRSSEATKGLNIFQLSCVVVLCTHKTNAGFVLLWFRWKGSAARRMMAYTNLMSKCLCNLERPLVMWYLHAQLVVECCSEIEFYPLLKRQSPAAWCQSRNSSSGSVILDMTAVNASLPAIKKIRQWIVKENSCFVGITIDVSWYRPVPNINVSVMSGENNTQLVILLPLANWWVCACRNVCSFI